jgi:hypothetical protein
LDSASVTSANRLTTQKVLYRRTNQHRLPFYHEAKASPESFD